MYGKGRAGGERAAERDRRGEGVSRAGAGAGEGNEPWEGGGNR